MDAPPVPPIGWESIFTLTPRRRLYYYNLRTRKSRWTFPVVHQTDCAFDTAYKDSVAPAAVAFQNYSVGAGPYKLKTRHHNKKHKLTKRRKT